MKLSLLERLTAINCLPVEGNIMFLRIRQEMIGKLGPTPEEITFYEYKETEDGKVSWNGAITLEAEIDLSDSELDLIRDNLKKLENESKLTPNHLSLYEKLI